MMDRYDKLKKFCQLFASLRAELSLALEERDRLSECLRSIVDNAEYQRGTTYEISTRDIERAERLLRGEK